MLENVLRSFTSWIVSGHSDAKDERGVFVDAHEVVIGVYQPEEDEPMVSLVVPSMSASYFSVRVELRRTETSGVEEILPMVGAVCFTEDCRNRLPFHGTVTQRARYRVHFTNTSDMPVILLPAILVHQP